MKVSITFIARCNTANQDLQICEPDGVLQRQEKLRKFSDILWFSATLISFRNLMHYFLQFGDASGIQSPVSFGGSGSLTRHLGRLTNGIYEAISDNLYVQPNLRASWLFQRAMLRDPVLKPFLQDVIQFGPLVKTLGLVMLTNPQLLPSIFRQVGIPMFLDWIGHFTRLVYYTFLSIIIDPIIRKSKV
ncbi:hypothetical protein POM88_015759 [Heracleum sosnowskyi]|uniref:Uncharacterized protein n=1 Tax=Heracleum sosnowskyi TaxID=360622 RepID=A0AAD8IMJ6_9APIA|nr:hypothetical protein POM88_015759 [Heracleum sosnowskyi]